MIREGLVKSFATSAVRPVTGDAGYPGLARRASPGLPSGIAVIVLAVVLGVAYYTNTCSKRIFILVCNEATGLDHSQLEGCRAFGLVPDEIREWRTVASYNPTARYAYAYVGSATKFGNDFACSKRFGLVNPTARHRD